ncbi:hypothetical protein [Aquiflexum gelatinilyticum]|uniref:hypothetical protein n=1 Tax=Aquiflexum gelatinilyticum TaxID=2961943 RepID=UPI0021683F7F|nr:hypothetical protein [Aquiflexum gelatinilyticum]MCS4433415.1 hypothetical protein [Aquiflexum gelatinilyticum]
MRTFCMTFVLSCFLAFFAYGQENEKKNDITIYFGPSHLIRQDLIFSPMVHRDMTFPAFGIEYSRRGKFYQNIGIQYAGFDPMVSEPFTFIFDGEEENAYPHYFTFIDLDYLLGKEKKLDGKSSFTYGGMFGSKVQVLNYVYGRISSFGYFASFGLGGFGQFRYRLGEKSTLTAGLQLPVFSWVARSPYLVNDDEFIDNISSHSGLKTFLAFIGDGKFATWNRIQYFDFDLTYDLELNPRWTFGARYWFEFIHFSKPRPLTSFRNSLQFQATYSF